MFNWTKEIHLFYKGMYTIKIKKQDIYEKYYNNGFIDITWNDILFTEKIVYIIIFTYVSHPHYYLIQDSKKIAFCSNIGLKKWHGIL